MKRQRVKTPAVVVASVTGPTSRHEVKRQSRLSLAYLADQHGKDPRVVYLRISRGWTIERALTEPVHKTSTASLARIASERGMTVESLVANILKAAPKRKVS